MPLSYRMPSCTRADIRKITDVIDAMRGADRRAALRFMEAVSPKGLCIILHSMRRWYSSQSGSHAKRLLAYRSELSEVMDLDPPIGVYRGFKVPHDSPLADVEAGDVVRIPVHRNSGCASWTLDKKISHRFSGASKGKTGIVVRLESGRGVKAFIAPPSCSKPWFNRLYERTMGKSFRLKEHEYAMCSPMVTVEVVQVKRK